MVGLRKFVKGITFGDSEASICAFALRLAGLFCASCAKPLTYVRGFRFAPARPALPQESGHRLNC